MRALSTTNEPLEGTGRVGVVGNQRLTALASAVLFVLFLVILATLPLIRQLLQVHIVVGVLLLGPLVIKLGTTGYRFVRYYTRSPEFVSAGPPRLTLRILAPLLVVTTLVLVGSGIADLATGPAMAGPFTEVHDLSAMAWIVLSSIHVFAYIRRSVRRGADDVRDHEHVEGRRPRLITVAVGVAAGAVAVVLLLPTAMPWLAWARTSGENDITPLVVSLVAAAVAIAAARYLKLVEFER